MTKQVGFTLIELVVVIIILGILAVIATPKFINLQSDARAATLTGFTAALKGSNNLVYSKSVINGKEMTWVHEDNDKDRWLVIDGAKERLATAYGYIPAGSWWFEIAMNVNIQEAGETDDTADWIELDRGGQEDRTVIYPRGSDYNKCHLKYIQPKGPGEAPVYSLVTEAC